MQVLTTSDTGERNETKRSSRTKRAAPNQKQQRKSGYQSAVNGLRRGNSRLKPLLTMAGIAYHGASVAQPLGYNRSG